MGIELQLNLPTLSVSKLALEIRPPRVMVGAGFLHRWSDLKGPSMFLRNPNIPIETVVMRMGCGTYRRAFESSVTPEVFERVSRTSCLKNFALTRLTLLFQTFKRSALC